MKLLLRFLRGSVFILPMLMIVLTYGQDIALDAAIVVQVIGTVTYQNAIEQAEPQKVQVFMKVFQGDQVTLSPDSQIALLYLKNGQKEIWRGPVVLEITSSGGKTEELEGTIIKPHIKTFSKHFVEPIEQTELPFPTDRITRGGITKVRGTELEQYKTTIIPVELTEQEIAEINEAKATYTDLKKELETNDITPELYLLSIFNEYDLYTEMQKILMELSEKDPDSLIIAYWMQWVNQRLNREKLE